jgi:hypothetical protein
MLQSLIKETSHEIGMPYFDPGSAAEEQLLVFHF